GWPAAAGRGVGELRPPPAGAEKLTPAPATPTPSLATTRTTAAWPSAVPTLPDWPPPLTSAIPAVPKRIVTDALSLTLVGVVAVMVTEPRLPVVVRKPGVEIVATVGTEGV